MRRAAEDEPVLAGSRAGSGHDSNVVIDEWSKLDEFVEKLPDPEKDPRFDAQIAAGPSRSAQQGLYLMFGWWTLFFEKPWMLRGMENLMIDYYEIARAGPQTAHHPVQPVQPLPQAGLPRHQARRLLDQRRPGPPDAVDDEPAGLPRADQAVLRPYRQAAQVQPRSTGGCTPAATTRRCCPT